MTTGIRIKPEENEVYLEKLKGTTAIQIFLHTKEDLVFSIDIYSFQPQNHPENHLGWWHFKMENGNHLLGLRFDFNKINESSLKVFKEGKEITPENLWVNPYYNLDPLQDCKLVFWNKNTEIIFLKRVLLKIDDKNVLKSFYKRQYIRDGYTPEMPFLHLLHQYKLKILRKYFAKYFRGRVLDVGCGLSLFTAIERKWKFKIFAGDIEFELMKERKEKRPDISWIVFDASHLPFKSESFDSIFAGEILEHLPGPEKGIKEWKRVHKVGGILIITTPNRERRINRINRQNWPFSPDHLREFSFEELNKTILPEAGYKPLKKKGIYIELFTKSNKWWKEDYLQREGNKKSNKLMMKFLNHLGFYFPKHSLDLITVAKKLNKDK
ncbi:MAG: class I SAM-dependent methyltransferase [Acidobacteriota bacterium]